MVESSPDAARAAGRPRGAQPSFASELVRTTFITEESVYGVILVAGMIVVSGGHGDTAWRVFWTVLITVLVFWAAHVYAGTVARHGLDHDRVVGLGEAFRMSLRRSLGLLASSAIPLVILLLGATRAIPDAYAIWAALWAGVAVLAVLGWIAFARRGASWPVRLAGSLGTAGFGIAMIVLKAVVH
ncbi:hypothetical protein [Agromyces sp. NPDC049794]|uniref:hypothetical protein n=1 Tax=unclassified Agromyces TaxID=2639701 RepID=UPI0033D6691D